MYNELSEAIEPKYLHIPIECNVLANRDDKEILSFSSRIFFNSCPLFINGMAD